MITRGQIAAKVRAHKDANPTLYCEVPACLWRVKHTGGSDTPCRKHPKPLPQLELECNRCHRSMLGTTAYDGACECGGLIQVRRKDTP
jgi:hypothetical protein